MSDPADFLSRGRAFSDGENALLESTSVITGADYARGERPPVPSPATMRAETARGGAGQ